MIVRDFGRLSISFNELSFIYFKSFPFIRIRMQKIVGISLVIQLVMAVTNLIKIPDFQGIPLTQSSAYFVELVDLRPDWYMINASYNASSQIRTLDLIDTNQWLDIESLASNNIVCQTVSLIPEARHILTFKYALASNIANANISVIWNSQLAEEFVANQSGFYNNTFFGAYIQGTSEICFNGESSDPTNSTGVLIDDIHLIMETRTDYIHFLIEVDQNNSHSILAFGNYTIQTSQLSKFYEVWINYENLSIAPESVFLINTQISLQFNLNQSFDFNKVIKIQLGSVQYLDFNYTLISFVSSYEIVNNSNTQPINSTNNTEPINSTNNTEPINSTNNTEPINSTNNTEPINSTNNTEPINSTNNTEPINSTNNTSNTDPINSTNSTYLISSTNNTHSGFQETNEFKQEKQQNDSFLKFFQSIDFSFLQGGYETAQKAETVIVSFFITSFIFKFINFANIMVLYIFLDIVLLDADVRNVFEGFAAILLKDGIFSSLYSLISGSSPDFMDFHLNLSEMVPAQRIHSGSAFSIVELTTNTIKLCLEDIGFIIFNGMKILVIYLIISQRKTKKWIEPNQKKFKYQLKRAFYLEIISVAPMWMLASGICLSYSQIAVLAHRNFREKINILMLIVLPFILLSGALTWRMIKTPNAVITDKKVKRIAKKKQQHIFESETNLQWFVLLNYTMFGFFISAFPIIVFFSATTFWKLAILGYQLINMTKNKYYILQLVRITIELMIHGGFLTLFIFDRIGIDELSSFFNVGKVTKYISILILFTYIVGCILEVIIFIFEGLMDVWQIIQFLCRSSWKTTEDEQKSIRDQNLSNQTIYIPVIPITSTMKIQREKQKALQRQQEASRQDLCQNQMEWQTTKRDQKEKLSQENKKRITESDKENEKKGNKQGKQTIGQNYFELTNRAKMKWKKAKSAHKQFLNIHYTKEEPPSQVDFQIFD